MKLYGLYKLQVQVDIYPEGTFVIPVEDYLWPIYLAEFWNFDEWDGAKIDSINGSNLLVATDEEAEEFQRLFKEYYDRNENLT